MSTLRGSDHKSSPDEIYARAWSGIKRYFVDQTFNGQNWHYWKDKYVGKLKSVQDANKAIETMISTLGDRNTSLTVNTDNSEDPREINGVGLKVGIKPGHKVFVFSVVDNSPAATAGVKRDWEIANIDGKSTEKLTLDQIVEHVRGPRGTSVVIGFVDGHEQRVVTLKRAKISVPTVIAGFVLPGDIKYIRLNSICESTAAELRHELAKLPNSKGLILDVRDCYGYRLIDALNVTELFLTRGRCLSIVRFRDGKKLTSSTFYARTKDAYTQHIAVLTNDGTAGSPEIIVAALRDNGASTYGQITNGDATFRKEISLGANATLNITAGIAISPEKKEHFYRRGLSPDHRIVPTLYHSDCTSFVRILQDGPWYLFASKPGRRVHALGEQTLSEPEPDELHPENRQLLSDRQLAAAYESLIDDERKR